MIRPPLTVLHVDSAREYRGGQNQARLLMAGLARRDGVRQALIAKAGSRLAEAARDLGVRVHAVPWRGAVDARALRALRSAFAEGWSMVHAHDGHAVQSVLLARALAGGGSPVLAARRVEFNPARPFVWQRSDLIVAVSDRVRDVLVAAGIDRRRVEVVRSGIDPRAVEPRPGATSAAGLRMTAEVSEDGLLLVAAVGALTPEKGHATFVRASAELAPRHPEVRFAVFGEGPERPRLEALIRAHDLEEQFRLPGEFPEAARALGGIDIFVMPSRREGLGSACIEAMLAGRPIVATGAGGLAELAVDGAFRPVPPEDPVALCAEIGRLIIDPAARQAAGAAARRAADGFTADRMVEGTLRCYRAVAWSHP